MKINSNNLYLLYLIVIFMFSPLLSSCALRNTTVTGSEETVPPIPEEIPEEIEVSEFILGPGDTVEIIVYRHEDLHRTVHIDTSGKITYPLIGDIQAGGLSIFQLRDRIRDGLSKYIIRPQVSVGVTAIQSQKVMVLGEVNKPGLFSLEGSMSTLEAISVAGGFTPDAKQKNVLLIRGNLEKPELIALNIDKIFNEHDMTQNVYLQNRDIIYVPATFIANVSRFFDHLSSILRPILMAGTGYWLGQNIEAGPRGAIAISPTR